MPTTAIEIESDVMQRAKDTDLRLDAIRALRKISGYETGITGHNSFAKLLGFKDMFDMYTNFDDSHRRVCRLLIGPHGYSVFKALEAKRSSNTHQE